MKLEIKIPKGWRKLRGFEILKHGDRFDVRSDAKWVFTKREGCFAGTQNVYIRKIRRKK